LDLEASEQLISTRVVRLWLSALESQYDPGTMRHLRTCGLTAGWRCLEVGAGSGTIAQWLSTCVGSSGQVIATDVDTRFLSETTSSNLEVWRHDIVNDPLPELQFDLVHARLLLGHMVDPEPVLRKLAASLKTGGWLVVEENDNISIAPDPRMGPAIALHEKVRTAAGGVVATRASRSDSGTFGRCLFGSMRALGLSDVDAEGRVLMVRGGHPSAVPWRLLYSQLGPAIIASGAITEQELAEYAALLENPAFVMMGEIMMAAWGRRTTA
jgi:ubiquinone/menaquinone biosynthesis C-methylase UbiE